MWAQALNDMAQVTEGESTIGGGSLPGSALPTRLVAIGGGGKRKGQNTAQTLARKLRSAEFPIIGRISANVLFLDPRSVLPEEDEVVLRMLKNLSLTR
jgi:L-seryl-tRNA(Ser) seleniumtransferase